MTLVCMDKHAYLENDLRGCAVVEWQSIKLEIEPNGYMTSKKRFINANETSRRHIDVDMTVLRLCAFWEGSLV